MEDILKKLDLSEEQSGAGIGHWFPCTGELLEAVSPVNGRTIGRVRCADKADCDQVIKEAGKAFQEWKTVPAPKRGEVVRQLGNAFREQKKELGALVSLEMGKIRAEGEGEIQEMIDMADFAVGQSRMLYGLSMQSERPFHRMYEQWHSLGPIVVITAFNFPVAVWAWNAMLALIAGDTVIWKPSSKVPFSAIAATKIAWRVLHDNGLPEGILNLVIGKGSSVGEALIKDRCIPLVSFTGSVRMGRHIGEKVSARLGRTLLELGGNNGIIVAPSADLNLAVRAILFGAIGTSGQRCTSTRRVIIHESIYSTVSKALVKAYKSIRIGNPLEEMTLMGPLVDREAVEAMQAALATLKEQGGHVLYGGEVLSGGGIYDAGTYVTPCICEAKADISIVREETFAPILYLIPYKTIQEAICYHNEVPQGLSSAIFTNDLREAELFLSSQGSDCGIANVNIGTSGAEIGGAFGGEKDTGGGRESGSDAWKAYMRRQTCTINWGKDLPLAQGIRFET
ncbi:MAG: aldehyde dehydrogenase family protein [Proteobacteria bacterium]|nr:aldehyde dehydrogenase family protein [Pseudomonadota bacterium]